MKITSHAVTRSALGIVVAAVLSVGTGVAAQASTPAVPEVPITAAQAKTSVLNTQKEVHGWHALPSGELKRLASGVLKSGLKPAGGFAIDSGKVKGWRVNSTSRLVRFSAAPGQGVLDLSSLTVVVNERGTVTGTSQYVLTPETATSGRVQSWVNGGLVMDQTVNDQGKTSSATASRSETKAGSPAVSLAGYKKGDWWGNLNQCLSGAGIAGWAIAGLSIACAAVCIVTIGWGCLGCLGAASAGFSGTVSFCVTKANQVS